jgi:hypothetical protein
VPNTDFIGTGFPAAMEYHKEERTCWESIRSQIDSQFPNTNNVLISLTWFGPQFDNGEWDKIEDCWKNNITYDNIFLLSTVDPPFINVTEIQEIKYKLRALTVYYLGNFDSPHEFNFFAPIVAHKFKKYTTEELRLTNVKYLYVNYNRKPRQHRIDFVKKLLDHKLDTLGIVTIGKDQSAIYNNHNSDLFLTIGEEDKDYLQWGNSRAHWGKFGVPHDMYSLHRIDIWQQTLLYINAATEFNPHDNLFCQQDTFKPMIGMRPFVINGVQRTYRWLRLRGFRTFNHYWPHIDIENGNVHDTLIELIQHLNTLHKDQLMAMYQDMLPDLEHNRNRFWEFAKEQKNKINHLFEL